MAEGTGLENRHTGEPGIESSNLSLSVVQEIATGRRLVKRESLAPVSRLWDGWPSG